MAKKILFEQTRLLKVINCLLDENKIKHKCQFRGAINNYEPIVISSTKHQCDSYIKQGSHEPKDTKLKQYSWNKI